MTGYARRSPGELREHQRRAYRLPSRFTVPVVGVSFREGHPGNLIYLGDLATDLRQLHKDPTVRVHLIPEHVEVVERALVEGGIPAEVVREPDNPADPLAVAVAVSIVPEIGSIGFVPATTCGCLAPLLAADMDAGGRWEALIPLDGVRITRDNPRNPGIQVTVYRVGERPVRPPRSAHEALLRAHGSLVPDPGGWWDPRDYELQD